MTTILNFFLTINQTPKKNRGWAILDVGATIDSHAKNAFKATLEMQAMLNRDEVRGFFIVDFYVFQCTKNAMSYSNFKNTFPPPETTIP